MSNVIPNIDLTGKRWHIEWLSNARQNGMLDPPIQSINNLFHYDNFEDLILCGSGPSLTADLAKIKARSEIDCLVIANHSNLATLLYHKIQPNYCLITDAGEATFTRLFKDVLPHWPDECRHIDFILPTHIRPDLVQLLRRHGIEPFFFANISSHTDAALAEHGDLYNSILLLMCPSIQHKDDDGNDVTFCLAQAGCVSNISLNFCIFLSQYRVPLQRVYLSGVDYSFPNGQNRCRTVSWNTMTNEFDVIENPDRHEKDPPLLRIGGMLTDGVQFGYYNDLRYIVRDIKANKLFDVFTTSNNFISDFVDVKEL